MDIYRVSQEFDAKFQEKIINSRRKHKNLLSLLLIYLEFFSSLNKHLKYFMFFARIFDMFIYIVIIFLYIFILK